MPHDRYLLTLNSVLDFAESNRRFSREAEVSWCSLFQEIVVSHDSIMTPGLIQGQLDDLAVPTLLANYSYAYFVAAVDVGLSGQVSPCYALLRMCIESAVYARAIVLKPELSTVWILRDSTPEDEKRYKAAFKITELIDLLPSSGAAAGDTIRQLYKRAISYGGHPNVDGALSIAGIEDAEERGSVGVELFSRGLPLLVALKSAAEVGYIMVCLEDLMFGVRLAPGTLPDRIHALGVEGLRELGLDGEEPA